MCLCAEKLDHFSTFSVFSNSEDMLLFARSFVIVGYLLACSLSGTLYYEKLSMKNFFRF